MVSFKVPLPNQRQNADQSRVDLRVHVLAPRESVPQLTCLPMVLKFDHLSG